MNVATLLAAVRQEVQARAYIARLEVLDQSRTLLKVRLHIAPDLFVQLYRNDRFDTTNYVLIYGGRRIMPVTNWVASGIVIQPQRHRCMIQAKRAGIRSN